MDKTEYSCKCGAAFVYKGAYERHIKSCDPEDNVCVCGYKTSHKSNYKRHKKGCAVAMGMMPGMSVDNMPTVALLTREKIPLYGPTTDTRLSHCAHSFGLYNPLDREIIIEIQFTVKMALSEKDYQPYVFTLGGKIDKKKSLTFYVEHLKNEALKELSELFDNTHLSLDLPDHIRAQCLNLSQFTEPIKITITDNENGPLEPTEYPQLFLRYYYYNSYILTPVSSDLPGRLIPKYL